MRGLGNFQRDMTSFIFDSAGNQLWPDAELVKGVNSKLVVEGNLQSYVTSEGEIGAFKNVTRVKASKIRPTKFAPNSDVMTDAQLDAAGSAQFRSAGKACRVVYLKD